MSTRTATLTRINIRKILENILDAIEEGKVLASFPRSSHGSPQSHPGDCDRCAQLWAFRRIRIAVYVRRKSNRPRG
jgi:hypothetical protein